MNIQTQLFDGKLIRLGAIDHEKDPQVEARWTHDPAYLRALGQEPAYPVSAARMKKKYEALEKEIEESKNMFYFTLRSKEDDHLLGFVRLSWIEWTHGNGNLKMGIGAPEDRGRGYGSDALRLILRYVFAELNLYRLTAVVGEDNPAALRFFERHGFVPEVRRRQALKRDGRTWDVIHLGILREEWLVRIANQPE